MNDILIKKARLSLMIILVIGFLIGGVAASEFGPWSVVTVAGAGRVGQYSSLALDSYGNPRISYYDQTKADLKYASWDGTRWIISTVDSTKRVGSHSSLALDSSGNPRISYYDQTKGDLKYASWDGTRWSISTVDSVKKVGEFSSLALDSYGNPRISYYDHTNADLKYASWDGTQWVISIVDGSSRAKGGTWDRLHTYKDIDSSGKWKEHRWDDDRFCPPGHIKNWRVGQYSSLALDSYGNPRISYYDQKNKDLKYAVWDGTQWIITTIDSSKKVGEYTSLALDGYDNPRISYYDLSRSNLKFAAWDSLNSKWVTETVDSSGRVGLFSSLALDSSGNARISYYDQKNRDLKYAAGDWTKPSSPFPTVTGITPDSGAAGTTVSITNLAGTNFTMGAGAIPVVYLAKPGLGSTIVGTDVVVVSPTRITCTIVLPAASTGTLGPWDVVVMNPDGQRGTKTAAFTVTVPPAPAVTGITPDSGVAGTSVRVTDLAGSNFVVGTTPEVWLAKPGEINITATDVTVVSANKITCTLALPAPSVTTAGPWDVVVKNADGLSGTKSAAFTVTNPAPAVTGITPDNGMTSTTVSVTDLAGMNFVVGTTPEVWLAKAGEINITATGVTVVSANKITCTLALPGPSATNIGQWDVVVKNADGQSGTKSAAFTLVSEITPPLVWDWSVDGWGDWQHIASWAGTQTGPCSEYGPVMVGSHGEHGSDVNLNRGSTESSVWKTFTAPYGTGWDTVTFSGLLSSSTAPAGRWMTIVVNGNEVFGAKATQTPPGNGQQFDITTTFPQAAAVTVKISSGQNPAWGPRFWMEFNSVTLSRSDAGLMAASRITPASAKGATVKQLITRVPLPFVKPDGSLIVGNETSGK